MKPESFMLIAGEASGDMLGAELVQALRQECADADAIPTADYQPLFTSLEPRFVGAGGPRTAAAGVDMAFDLTEHSVIGFTEVLRNYFKFRRLFAQLVRFTLQVQPDAIIGIDFSGFNRRFAHAIKQYVRSRSGWFHDWDPKFVQYVSPQVWASREGRIYQMARDYDLVLSIFPFEKEWYAQRVPQLRVEFVGHPIVDRYKSAEWGPSPRSFHSPSLPTLVLLPGSRAGELNLHLPVMLGALAMIRAAMPELRVLMVLPSEELVQQAKAFNLPAYLQVRSGGLPACLAEATVAIASTGTVTVECAYFGVPTVALYKTSWSTFQVAKRLAKVKCLAMPNLLAKEEIFPEFIQDAATAENIAQAALALLRNETRRAQVKAKLAEVVASLGSPGASRRAARAILRLLRPERHPTLEHSPAC